VRTPAVAAQYLDYWTALAADTPAPKLRLWTVQKTPDPTGTFNAGVYPVFSPRSSDKALAWYSDQIDGATAVSGFTAAFGVNKRFAAVLKANSKNVRYVLLEKTGPTYAEFRDVKNNFISIGAVLTADAVGDGELQRWVAERLTGLNDFVKYLHTKYLFIDPLGDNPTVISGSANFSDASTVNNDENMLVVQGDTTVADIYLGEFMRLWNHFFFRDIANRYARVNAALNQPAANGNGASGKRTAANAAAGPTPYLHETDVWTDDYYGKNFRKTSERTLFA
jgi:phosphatidylserine/phosphatidylglycerophosphate/cardiolipin synthase-like enzyme